MRKKLLSTILVTSMIATSLLVGCGSDNKSKADATSSIETTMDESSSVEETTLEPTTSVEEESSTIEESTTSAEGTSNEDTSKVEEESTSKVVEVETTTKAPETTTVKKPEPTTTKETTTSKKEPTTTTKPQETTTTPPETTTSAPKVETESIKKLKSLHIADTPKEALDFGIKLVEGQGYVIVYGPTYRVEADYVDEDHFGANCRSQYQDICEQGGNVCDGHSKNPYVMNEWTTRKYWGDKDEVTVGYYCTDDDMDFGSPVRSQMDSEIKSTYGNFEVEPVIIGQYEGERIWFVYYFKYTP